MSITDRKIKVKLKSGDGRAREGRNFCEDTKGQTVEKDLWKKIMGNGWFEDALFNDGDDNALS